MARSGTASQSYGTLSVGGPRLSYGTVSDSSPKLWHAPCDGLPKLWHGLGQRRKVMARSLW